MAFDQGLVVECEREKEIMNNYKDFDLGNCVYGHAVY